MAIKIGGNTVIDDSQKWTGREVPGAFIGKLKSVSALQSFSSSLGTTSSSKMDNQICFLSSDGTTAKSLWVQYSTYSGNSVNATVLSTNLTTDETTAGTPTVLSAGSLSQTSTIQVLRMSDTTAIVCYRSGAGILSACVLTVSGTTVSAGSLFTIDTSSSTFTSVSLTEVVEGSTYAVAYCAVESASSAIKARILSVSGTTITGGTVYTHLNAGSTCDIAYVGDNKLMLVFIDSSVVTGTYSVTSNVCTVTSTAHPFSKNYHNTFTPTSGTMPADIRYITDTTANTITFNVTTADTSGNIEITKNFVTAAMLDISGTTISATGNNYVLHPGGSSTTNNCPKIYFLDSNIAYTSTAGYKYYHVFIKAPALWYGQEATSSSYTIIMSASFLSNGVLFDSIDGASNYNWRVGPFPLSATFGSSALLPAPGKPLTFYGIQEGSSFATAMAVRVNISSVPAISLQSNLSGYESHTYITESFNQTFFNYSLQSQGMTLISDNKLLFVFGRTTQTGAFVLTYY